MLIPPSKLNYWLKINLTEIDSKITFINQLKITITYLFLEAFTPRVVLIILVYRRNMLSNCISINFVYYISISSTIK